MKWLKPNKTTAVIWIIATIIVIALNLNIFQQCQQEVEACVIYRDTHGCPETAQCALIACPKCDNTVWMILAILESIASYVVISFIINKLISKKGKNERKARR